MPAHLQSRQFSFPIQCCAVLSRHADLHTEESRGRSLQVDWNLRRTAEDILGHCKREHLKLGALTAATGSSASSSRTLRAPSIRHRRGAGLRRSLRRNVRPERHAAALSDACQRVGVSQPGHVRHNVRQGAQGHHVPLRHVPKDQQAVLPGRHHTQSCQARTIPSKPRAAHSSGRSMNVWPIVSREIIKWRLSSCSTHHLERSRPH